MVAASLVAGAAPAGGGGAAARAARPLPLQQQQAGAPLDGAGAGAATPPGAAAATPAAAAASGARSANLLHALSGGVAGALAKTATAPLARLVILYQVEAFAKPPAGAAAAAGSGAPFAAAASGAAAGASPAAGGARFSQPGIWEALKRVARSEGVASLWKGNLVTIIHRVPYSSMNFYTYEATSRALAEALPPGSDVTRRMGAGGMAGLVACSAAYPLDLVRTRLAAQTSGSYYSGIGGTLRRIVADEGPKGLYRGLGATLVQVVPSLALSFTVYETARSAAANWEAQRRGERGAAGSSGGSGRQAGAGGGGGEWDLAQALQQRGGGGGGAAAGSGGSSPSSSGGATSSTDSSPSSSSHGLAKPPPVSPLASLACGCVSGVVTATATFPLDVVRRRMQVEGAGRAGGGKPSYLGVMRSIVRSQGVRGFYAGLVAEYAKVVPGVAIAYGTYEAMKSATHAD